MTALEFFAWGLLTSPMITVLNETFPDHTFLMNGLIMGIKGMGIENIMLIK